MSASRLRASSFAPLLWVGPAMALIAVVVLWPVIIMIRTAFQHISPDGFILGSAGWRNFHYLWQEPDLGGILIRTVIWVIVVVAATMLISLAMAQLFNQKFPGRRVARWALIAPWAASVMMTSIVFRWALDPNNGVINVFLHDIGYLNRFNSDASDWLGSPGTAFAWMMVVAVFVSIPFATYALLAGLQGIPTDIYEAARVDGAGAWRTYRTITLPLLRPAFVVALLINVINVFNSFPIIWEMTRGGPGHQTSTTTTFMYQLKQSYIGESAAMSVLNFGLVMIVVLLYLRATAKRREDI
ncbi:sugar ABC transporter permease [Acidisoma cellulosilytica]|uniref:Sugar ABC transporter permease n=1 Tax=Acidisoma cellulosilyticum TaxID=2802395 RepID=A0A963Z1J2_9PROT|nr:sugar ABC transporter permease [Acidisoma cellulosilyticum]MCB8881020.1 sugar ABC transporter permease [Acidisoma cellulosilyticum]